MILPVAMLFGLSIRSRRALGATDSPSPDDTSVWRQALLITLSPAMVILWVQVVVLPYLQASDPEPLWRAVTITPFLLLVVAAGVVTITRRIWPNRGRRIGALSGTIALGLFTVLGYPLVVYLFHIADSSRTRMQDALLALAINALYLALAFVVASLGAHSVAAWAFERGRMLNRSLKLLVHGTSLLLVLLVFFGITADVWQVAVASSIWRFLAVIGLIWLLTMFLLAYRSETVIEEGRKFNSWEEVEHVALVEQDAGGHRPQDAPLLHELFRDVESAQEDDLSVPLNRRARMNAMTVMLVYQGFRVLVVGISMTLFFAALGYLAVPDSLAREWSLNGLMSPDGRTLVHRPFYDLAWVRIAALLGVISSLFIVLHVMRDPNEREAFFKDVEVEVRRRFAIRLAYLRSLRQQPATSSAEASDGGTAQPQEAVATAPASQTGQP
jgi:hypothetical protein